jgi:uncharacterized protein YbgA (DUF1722 family)/uncharacterized protein YbbK (DUF523 family)
MRIFSKPIVIVSKCIEFEACRYNGQITTSDVVRKLKQYVQFSPVCPEIEIGLGVPRTPIRIVSVEGISKLIQPAKDADVTAEMEAFANSFLDSAVDVDGFILKSRSPSCGIKDVKIHSGKDRVGSISKGNGFFGGAVMKKFPQLALEDEGRLTNFTIREYFLTKLFTFVSFRQVKKSKTMRALVQFHTENKLLLMAYNQKELRMLGRIVANLEKKPLDLVIKDYEKHLWDAFARPPRYTSNINVLLHAFGYFSKGLSSKEKLFFLNSIEEYRDERVPLSVPLNTLKSWSVRFEENYLLEQTFLGPYPSQMMEITDSGKGRNL